MGVSHGQTLPAYLPLLLAATALAAVLPREALAQADASAQGNPQDASVEEVVVRGEARKYLPDEQTTATGLSMRLIETPQAISVVTPEMLSISNSRTAYDAADMVPGVEKGGSGASREYLLLRGRSLGLGGRSRINGIGGTRNSFPDSFALERIEFVRGPATVLYGVTAAFGGEVNSLLKAPRRDFGSQFAAHFGDFDRKRYEADITGAIPGTDERLTARAAGAYTEFGSPVKGIDRTNRDRMMMASLAYELPSDWRASLYYYREERDIDPMDGCTLVVGGDGALRLPEMDAEHYYCGDPLNSFQHQTQQFVMGSVEKRFANNWKLTLLGGRARTHDVYSYMYPYGPGIGDHEVSLYTYDPTSFQEQYTFNMSLGGEIDVLERKPKFFAAVEYHEMPRSGNRDFYLRSVGVGVIDMRTSWSGVLADGSPIPFIDRSGLPVTYASEYGQRNLRGSLQGLVSPIERLEVMAGLLYQSTDIVQQRTVPLNDAVEQSYSELVKRLGLTYQLTDGWGRINDMRAYGTYAEGFAPNFAVFDINGDPFTQTQDMKAYEIGLKAEAFGGAVAATIAAYDQKVTNIPALVLTPGDLSIFHYELKGTQAVRGLEAELLGEVLPGWNVAVAYGYTETDIEDAPQNTNLDLRIHSVPKNRVSVYTTYEFLRGPVRGLRVGGALIYKDDYPFVDSSPSIIEQYGQLVDSGYTRIDLNASYSIPEGPMKGFEVFGNVENLTDENYYYSRNGTPAFTISHAPPRTVTFGLRYRFGGGG